MHLLANELAGLGARTLSLALVPSRALNRLLLGHLTLLDPPLMANGIRSVRARKLSAKTAGDQAKALGRGARLR